MLLFDGGDGAPVTGWLGSVRIRTKVGAVADSHVICNVSPCSGEENYAHAPILTASSLDPGS
eukprot:3214657-Pyramimonas_sp.AAC.1